MRGKQIINKPSAKLKFNFNKLREKLLSMRTKDEDAKIDDIFLLYLDMHLERAIMFVCDRRQGLLDTNEWLLNYSKDEVIWLAFVVKFSEFIEDTDYIAYILAPNLSDEQRKKQIEEFNDKNRIIVDLYTRLIHSGEIGDGGALFDNCVYMCAEVVENIKALECRYNNINE